jgi:hypothetical protein
MQPPPSGNGEEAAVERQERTDMPTPERVEKLEVLIGEEGWVQL